jgi:hypothetical protein
LIVDGTSDVVPQIAIQQFDLRRANGIDECMRILLFGRRGRTMTAERPVCLLFALRSLQFMRRSPAVLREIQLDALRMVGDAAGPAFPGLLLDGPPDMLEQLALTLSELRPTIEDTSADLALRLGAVVVTMLLEVPGAPAILARGGDYIQTVLLARERELSRLSRAAPDLITEMRRRRWLPRSHQIAP